MAAPDGLSDQLPRGHRRAQPTRRRWSSLRRGATTSAGRQKDGVLQVDRSVGACGAAAVPDGRVNGACARPAVRAHDQLSMSPPWLMRLVLDVHPDCVHLGRSCSAVLLPVPVLRGAMQSSGLCGSDACLIASFSACKLREVLSPHTCTCSGPCLELMRAWKPSCVLRSLAVE